MITLGCDVDEFHLLCSVAAGVFGQKLPKWSPAIEKESGLLSFLGHVYHLRFLVFLFFYL